MIRTLAHAAQRETRDRLAGPTNDTTMARRFRLFPCAASAALLLVVSSGCDPRVPPIVPVSGTVYLDGQPLPFARVEFVPDLKHFGAETNSFAVTDENGHFSLVCMLQQQPGAVVANHHVLVMEHTPDEMRGMSARAQQQLAEYQAKLKNRPIPDFYAMVSQSPVTVEVKAGQETYDIQLTRRR